MKRFQNIIASPLFVSALLLVATITIRSFGIKDTIDGGGHILG